MIAIIIIDYNVMAKISPILYVLFIIALIGVLFTEPINGAKSWFKTIILANIINFLSIPAAYIIKMFNVYLKMCSVYQKMFNMYSKTCFADLYNIC